MQACAFCKSTMQTSPYILMGFFAPIEKCFRVYVPESPEVPLKLIMTDEFEEQDNYAYVPIETLDYTE